MIRLYSTPRCEATWPSALRMERAFSGLLKSVNGSFENTPFGWRGRMVEETPAMAITNSV